MKRIGILANTTKPQAVDAVKVIAAKCRDYGMELFVCDETADLAPMAHRVAPDQLESSIDVLLALGGDGTMLHALRVMGHSDIPVAGVNLGSLGFMTTVPQNDAGRLIDVLAAGTFHLSRRTLAVCVVSRNGAASEPVVALNDLVVGWGASPRVITLRVAIDGTRVTSYMCDGLIVSTPTGSTGHNLSAGGPILHPETPAFVLNVICPHTLSTRPLVIPDDSVLTVEVAAANKDLILSIDGQEQDRIRQGDHLEIRRHPRRVRFLHLPDYSYFSVLRQKLGWSGSSV